MIHVLVFGSIAAFLAPFGGFLASGFKRGNKVKDFGKLIPGHGGIIDRIDCIAMMMLFSGVYIT